MTEENDVEIYEEDDKPFDAADPAVINAARKRAARIRKKRLDFVTAMMSMTEGRLWIYDLLVMCHVAETTHTPGDPYSTAFREGERNVALKILSDISEASPEKYMLMMTEGKSEK